MNSASLPYPTGVASPLSVLSLSRVLIAMCVFAGAFVMREPGPYEILLITTMIILASLGLQFSKHALLLGGLFSVFCTGGLLSMLTMDAFKTVPVYLSVTLFLALSSVFFCAIIEMDQRTLRTIMRSYVVGGVITALLGIAGYFKLFSGAEIFTRYDRAMGAFQDPNVFGPFLVLPLLYLIHGSVHRNFRSTPLRLILVFILLTGLFLSFSRAAWGLMALSTVLLFLFSLTAAKNERVRKRLFLVILIGAITLFALVIGALQFETVGAMFEQRAKLVQSYDSAQLGRFARHAIGFGWALEKPFGIGALEFGLQLGEDTHNIWLKALMGYGWLGFAAFVAVSILTLTLAGRCLDRPRPWQGFLICAYSAFVGHLVIAWVIDIDHWRHFYLIIGILWGCVALEAKHQRNQLAKG